MKHFIFCLLISFGLMTACKQTTSQAGTQTGMDTSMAIRNMITTIEQETNYFFAGDYAAWTGTWVHDSRAMQGWNNSDGTFDAAIGWDNIDRQGKAWIQQYYRNGERVIHPSVKREKPAAVFFSENTAFLSWKQYNADSTNKMFVLSQETRLMQHIQGSWKILTVLSLWDSKHKIPADSLPKSVH